MPHPPSVCTPGVALNREHIPIIITITIDLPTMVNTRRG